MKTITIGRDSSCDIVINNLRVSRMHGVITLQNNNYIYRDNSTNGTIINGVLVNKSEMSITVGDTIMLASDEPLPWRKVTSLLPIEEQPQQQSTPAQQYSAPRQQANGSQAKATSSNQSLPPSYNKWNWGAFFFGWLWAVTSRIYWPLIVFIPVIGWFTLPIVNIVLGINGNKWAWEKDSWESIEAFERVQFTWAKVAAIFICAILLGGIIFMISMVTFLGELFSFM